MKITLESTTKIVTLNGVEARVWEGKTAAGVPVIAMISRIAVAQDADQRQFEAELLEQRAPSAQVQAWPARFVLD